MAIEDFLTVDDAKLTVEKSVREKPKLKDLITVEVPGKPTSALQLEETPKKKSPKKRRAKKPTNKAKEITKKDSILIITEKPQAALKIAQALHPYPDKFSEKRVPYYELTYNNQKILVASAVGHLYNLTYSKGQSGYPVFKVEWVPSHTRQKTAKFTKSYLELLKKLSKRAKEYVIATDYDVEGEVIGWNVLRFICNQSTAKRMKYSTLTKDELVKAFENPLSEPDWGQAYAGESRHILDWLYGINLSRALMASIKTTGSFKILSIGRVQGPALKIIVDREREIASFKAEPFWKVTALTENNKTIYTHPKDIFDKSLLDQFKSIKEANAITKNTQESIPPQPPFDLTSLQRESYRHLGISPSQTLKIAQKLYLDGLISYPRTSSQKIPPQIKPKDILKKLKMQFPEQVVLATRPKPIEGYKSDPAHPSIYPTGEIPKKIDVQTQKLYLLIVKRFISCFCQDAITANRRTKLESIPSKLPFTASGLKVIDPGWTKVYSTKLDESSIPDLNGKVKIEKIDFLEKLTQAPKRYTPTSLITILEKKGLGTKATRSSIVETLFNRGYLEGKSIQATQLGIHLIEALEKYSPIIIDEQLTKKIEEQMTEIQVLGNPNSANQEGLVMELKEKRDLIVKEAEKIITDISKDFKTQERQIGKDILKGIETQREKQQEDNTLTKTCPTCNTGKLRITYSPKFKRSFISCNNYPSCKQTYSLPPRGFIKPSGTDCPECAFPKIKVLTKGRKPWEICFNIDCPNNQKRRDAYEKKNNL